ncbi:MAG: DUF2029 domain-containing protein [Prevotella sp.]|nr:DUF2029 domain-containing protein [Prevotella sp.]
MNNTLTIAYKFVDRYSYPILLTLFILWMFYGIFPLRAYETDGQEIILGCDIMYREGWSFPPIYSYEYRMQPLITIMIVSLKHLMPFFTCEQIYCVMTVVASLIFLFGSMAFIQHVTQASKTRILIATMLLPEIYAIAMYPNSAIPAAACFIWALIMISKERYALSGLLLCLAVLFRLDIVIVFPTVLPMLVFEGKSFKKALGVSAVYAGVVVVIGLFFFWLMGAQALGTYGAYQKWNFIITSTERILSITGFYSLAYFLLMPVGLGVIIAKKLWKTLFLILVPVILLHSVYVLFGNASKHFLYNAPFVIIAGVYALQRLEQWLSRWPVLKWFVLLGFILFMTVSVRKSNLSLPWFNVNPLSKVGIVKPLYYTERGGTSYELGIGAGFQLVTNDENMLLTGHVFYPWYIRSIKEIIGDWRQQQKTVLDTVPTSNILTLEWGVSAPISYDFMTEQYHYHRMEKMPETYCYTLTSPRHDLHFWRIVMPKALTDKQQLVSYLDSVSSHIQGGDLYLLSASNHYGASYFMDELVPTGRLEKKAEKLYKVNK